MTLPPPPIRLPEGQRITHSAELTLGPHPAFAITRTFDTGQGRASPLGRFHRSNLDLLLRDGPDGGYEFIGIPPTRFPSPLLRDT